MIALQMNPVDTTTLQMRVYCSLRDRIADGLVEPGEIFTLRSLAAALGTSVMPVRDAVTRLNAEGAVEIKLSSRQITVPVMSRDSVTELYAVRIELEGMAAALAADLASPEDISNIEAAFAAIDLAIVKQDEKGFLPANRAFHFAIYRAARSHHLLPIIEMLWLKFGPLLRVPLQPGTRAKERVMKGGQHCHEEALAALRARDVNGARSAIQSDLFESAAWFAEHYDPAHYLPETRKPVCWKRHED